MDPSGCLLLKLLTKVRCQEVAWHLGASDLVGIGSHWQSVSREVLTLVVSLEVLGTLLQGYLGSNTPQAPNFYTDGEIQRQSGSEP